jgi:hypothetical protein
MRHRLSSVFMAIRRLCIGGWNAAASFFSKRFQPRGGGGAVQVPKTEKRKEDRAGRKNRAMATQRAKQPADVRGSGDSCCRQRIWRVHAKEV